MAGNADDCPVAGLGRRLGAMLYDAFLLFGLFFAAVAILMPFTGGQAIEPGNYLLTAYLIVLACAFYSWCWTRSGQTLGMLAWNIRIQQPDGSRINWLQALMRLSAALLSWLALGLGFWWILFDRDGLSWHDRLSRTRIVRVRIGGD